MCEQGRFRFTFRDEAEREEARVMAARLLVRQAGLLGHDIEPEIAATARLALPNDRVTVGR